MTTARLISGVTLVVIMTSCIHHASEASPASPRSPGERIGHGLAYDTEAGVVILFGGVNPAGESLGDTWLWNGERWRLGSTTGPSPRKWPTMVFDPDRNRTVLFGGRVGAGTTMQSAADTWEWTGSEWVQLPHSGPPGRDHAAMTYDRARRRTILHGGWSGSSFLSDTWELSSERWRLIAATGPSARAAHSLTYDERRQEVILFGGRAPGFLSDTWILRGTEWLQAAPTAPPPARAFHAATFHSRSGQVILFGGRDGPELYADTWAWDGTEWRRLPFAGPSARGVYAIVDDRARDELLFHGGGSMPVDRWLLHDETWALSAEGWVRRWPSSQR